MSKRPDILYGQTAKCKTPCGNVYVTVNSNEGAVCEVFIKLGKSGTCPRAMLEGLGRVMSLALRSGASRDDLTKTLKGINCGQSVGEVPSCLTRVAEALEKFSVM